LIIFVQIINKYTIAIRAGMQRHAFWSNWTRYDDIPALFIVGFVYK